MTTAPSISLTIAPREFRALPGTDGYQLEILQLGTELRVERLRRERGELVGELTVLCSLMGTRSATGILHVADFNLSSARARTERARILAERANTTDIDWTGLLEELCQHVIREERAGQPAVVLRDVPAPAPDDSLQVDGIRILRRLPMCVFGDGGDGKSLIALNIGTRLAVDHGLRILYADWEFSGEDHRARLERIAGPIMPASIWYARCERPLVDEADRLRRIVGTESIDYLIADSVAFACDGPPEAAEVAARYFRALRRIGVGSLNVAHVRQENGEHKPFGSSFWHNGFRSTIFAKRSTSETAGEGILDVALFNRKQSTGPASRPTGYRIAFDDERTTFATIEVAEMDDMASKVPVVQRMANLIGREGAMTMAAIASALDTPVDTIVKTTKRHEGKRFVRLAGTDGVYRIGLLAEGAA
jgi:hypothetical protein